MAERRPLTLIGGNICELPAGDSLPGVRVGEPFFADLGLTDGSTKVFTLPTGTAATKYLIVTINGLIQRPTIDYTVVGDQLVFVDTPPVGAALHARNFGFLTADAEIFEAAAENAVVMALGTTVYTRTATDALLETKADLVNGKVPAAQIDFPAPPAVPTKTTGAALRAAMNDTDFVTPKSVADAAALVALTDASNIVARENVTTPANVFTVTTGGVSGWGFSMVGTGSDAQTRQIAVGPLKQNTPYSLSFMARRLAGSGSKPIVFDLFPDTLPQREFDIQSNAWTRYTWENFSSAHADMTLSSVRARFFRENMEAGLNVEITDIKLEEGAKATAYTPSPKDVATIAIDLAAGTNFTATLVGNRTLGAPSNAKPGMSGTILIKQDATGSRTLAYNTAWKPFGSTPALSTAANAVDLLTWIVEDGGKVRFTLAKGGAA